MRVFCVCMYVEWEVFRVPTADQIFIEFHLNGHTRLPLAPIVQPAKKRAQTPIHRPIYCHRTPAGVWR